MIATATRTRADRLALAATVAADYAHDAPLSFATAELAARWAVESYVAGNAHVPGSREDESPFGPVPAALRVADEALAAVRAAVEQTR